MIHLFLLLGLITLYALGMLDNKKGRALFTTGILIHAAYIVYRGTVMGRLPVTDRYDILGVMAFLSASSFFYFHYIKKAEGVMNTLPLLPVFLCFLVVFQERVDTISPNMNSVWFYLYMTLFILGFVLLGLGSVLGVTYLKDSRIAFEILQYRMTLAGWLLFSLALVAGSVWFYLSYGVYWLWTAKELWTTIAWFYYGFYLHARLLNSLKGWVASEVGAAGFLILTFAYLGVTPVLGSPWTQF